MKVSLFGAGYVGLSFAASLAEAGHEVLCADADPARIEGLQRGLMPLARTGARSAGGRGHLRRERCASPPTRARPACMAR
jgi:UDPglucose 6-dehydrogenase